MNDGRLAVPAVASHLRPGAVADEPVIGGPLPIGRPPGEVPIHPRRHGGRLAGSAGVDEIDEAIPKTGGQGFA
ncbi:MAG: hypothetical protein DCC67_17390 [Planctomycetota bacterium]|nr:MAG: hypothetical protein DCC67_17390 [Planctomycetota bacterium]